MIGIMGNPINCKAYCQLREAWWSTNVKGSHPGPTHRRSVDRDGRLRLAGDDIDGQELGDALLQLQLVGPPAFGQPIRSGLLIRQDGGRIEVGIRTGV